MSRERTDYERLVDNALLLSLWSMAQEQSPDKTVGGRTKATKLAFLAAYPLYQSRIKAFSFEFFKWNHGPMATNLTGTVDYLSDVHLAVEPEDIVITDEGVDLGRAFTAEVLSLPVNKPVLYEIERVALTFGPQGLHEILDKVYGMMVFTRQHPTQRRSIAALKHNETITQIIEEEDADLVVTIPEEWEITLALSMQRGALENLQKGIADTYEGRVYSADEFWSTL